MTSDHEPVKFKHVNKPRSYGYAFGAVALFLFAVLSMTQCAEAQSATATVSWTNPTTNVNGTPIPAAPNPGSLTLTRVEYGSCAGTNVFGTKAGEVTAAQPATSVVISSLLDATTYCFRAFARNTYGAESLASNVASKTTLTPVPNPPVLSATITVAYELNNTGAGVKLGRQVATLPLGTECNGTIVNIDGVQWYGVDVSKVTLVRPPKSQIIVTQCVWS